MVNAKTYSVIFVVLFVLATVQAGLEYAGILEQWYWPVFGLMMVLSFWKAYYVAGYFQHLKYEPRYVSYVVGIALLAALALTVAAAYSIT